VENYSLIHKVSSLYIFGTHHLGILYLDPKFYFINLYFDHYILRGRRDNHKKQEGERENI
jgi:hypothetical protein